MPHKIFVAFGYHLDDIWIMFIKKILISLLAILAFSLFLFWNADYFEEQLASLSGIITAWVTINPLGVDVSAPSEVEINKVFKVTAKVINKGEEKIENTKAEIILSTGLVLLKKDPVQGIGVIPGKKEKKISWSVKGEEIGYHLISIKVSGELEGKELSKESSTTMVEIIEKAAPGKRAHFNFFQRFFDFFQKWLDRIIY